MNILIYLLTCFTEECVELAHITSKVIRFTPYEVSPSHDKSNMLRMEDEYNDMLAIKELLEEFGIKLNRDEAKIAAKKEKFFKYLGKAVALKTVTLDLDIVQTDDAFEKYGITDFLSAVKNYRAFNEDDGTGYYATLNFQSDVSVFAGDGKINLPPVNMTHVNWYSK
jgi:hypothetical protein